MTKQQKHSTFLAAWPALAVLMTALTVAAQTPGGPQPLPAAQTLEREMTGAQTHSYRLSLKKGEFFQVRAEQKGVDVKLRLLDAGGSAVATMDSPNGKGGPEMLSFVAEGPGSYVLEVSAPDAKAEKGAYTIRRETPRAATVRDRRRVEVERLFVEGVAARSVQGQAGTAVTKFREALNGWRELEDSELAALAGRQVRTMELIVELGAPNSLHTEGNKLIREGRRDSVLAARVKYVEGLEAARKFFKRLVEEDLSDIVTKDVRANLKVNAKMDEMNALMAIGNTHDALSEWQESVNYNSQGLSVIRGMREDPEIAASKAFASYPIPVAAIEASSLAAISSTLTTGLNKPHEALSYGDQALTRWREVQREHEKYRSYAEYQEAMTLQGMGQSHLALDDRNKAVGCFEQSLTIFRRLPGQKSSAASVLFQIGNIYSRLLDYGKARGAWDEALKIYEELGDRTHQVSVLGAIGLSHFGVNDEQKAREYFNRQLAILLSDDYMESAMKQTPGVSLPDHKGEPANVAVFRRDQFEWTRSTSIGGIYTLMGEIDKGREHYEKSLVSARAMGNQNTIRLSLSFIGSTYELQEKWPEALDYYKQTLEVGRLLPGKSAQASDLSSLAAVNIQLKQWPDALRNATEALLLYQSLGAGDNNLFVGYAGALNLLARAHHGFGNRRLAIFYEKQAVNAIQRERRQLQNLDRRAQSGYLEKNQKPYRRLADWLIEEGRLPEAEQVLEMLKEEEFFQFVRRDDKVASALLRRVEPNSVEEGYLKRYGEIADQLTRLGTEADALEAERKQYPPDQPFPKQARLQEVEGLLRAGRETFRLFLKELETEFGKENVRVRQVESGLQKDLKRWNAKGVVVISTITGKDRLNLIVTSADAQRAHTIDTPEAKLNQLIGEFRQAVRNECACLDPRPSGQQLYNILVRSIEGDLKGAGATTLLWSLDGALRYVPVAALYDREKGYLVERFANVVITLANRTSLGQQPAARAGWQALGLGVSKPYEDFLALDAVPEELRGIIREQPTERGVVPGKRLQDEQFNYAAFRGYVGRYPMVHIASHFSLRGKDTESFLLLGGGERRKLTVADLRSEHTIFNGVELLTLSACDTATGNTGLNGEEIESFSMIAQEQGAVTVMASLWPVADPSTRDLMVEFYRQLKTDPRLTKADALRLTQRAMIEGKLSPPTVKADANASRAKLAGQPGQDDDRPKFPFDKSRPYAHPYFWSPFVLSGNWR
ncbi:MAG TPA: CHAT domain-containing protein [Pyrinomonadaceae bacterium]|jgi:CHAT domain-containing protein/tetratricopeptide (TPR) repeat protein